MDTIVVIIVSVTLIAIFGSVYLEVRGQIKPRIRVYFPDGSTQISYKAKEEAPIAIHIKNSGRFGFPKPVVTEISILVYAPTNLLLKEFQCAGGDDNNLKKAPLGGIFGGMHYLGGKTTLMLFDKEEEVITVLMQMPEQTGKQTLKIATESKQGDLSVHNLEIIVY